MLALADVKEKLGSQGTVPLITSPQEMSKFLLAERERWSKVIKDTGFKIE